MGKVKQQLMQMQEEEARGQAHGVLEEAHKLKKIGIRQYGALKKHAMTQSPEHITAMIKHMQHMNFRDAHKAAMQEAGE